jgi:membrane-bound inhibitor of C-type lysozyme
MNKKLIAFSLILTVVVIYSIWYFNQPTKQVASNLENNPPIQQAITENIISAVFNCDKGITIKADFNNNQPRKVSLEISDGRKIELPQAISASGARYANTDESFVFWNKGDTAFVQENGTTTITGCLTK